jgi:Histidine kinase-, DNA gyrase B-, and HSP90-like ATPase
MHDQPEIGHIPTAGTIILPPAPRSLEALGRNHSLEAALAELVDNAIDADARHVLIRFVQSRSELVGLVVVDDGHGMSDTEIDIAMTVGGERDYGPGEIGRFGFGLKAASFSQADVMTVFSRREGHSAVGRRWQLHRAKEDFSCEIVEPGFAGLTLDADWELPPSASGTLIRWDAVRGFPAVADEAEVERFLAKAIERIKTHLGLIYHRLLERSAIHILVDVEDLEEGLGQRIEIGPLNPFRYPRSGVPGWPRDLPISGSNGQIDFQCHIWPGRSQLDEFRLDGDKLARQGIYVYFNERLIQRGGWNNLVLADTQLSLARVSVDISGDIPGFLSVKPEKNGIEPGPRFASLVLRASFTDGSSFEDYIEAARGYLKESNRRQRLRKARIPPGSGFDPRIRRVIKREIPMRDDEPIQIRWAPLPAGQFFEVDRDEATLWLNKRYRAALAGGRPGSLNDFPVLKTLLYLVFEEVFEGQHLGSRDRDNIELWQDLLICAAEAEVDDA